MRGDGQLHFVGVHYPDPSGSAINSPNTDNTDIVDFPSGILNAPFRGNVSLPEGLPSTFAPAVASPAFYAPTHINGALGLVLFPNSNPAPTPLHLPTHINDHVPSTSTWANSSASIAPVTLLGPGPGPGAGPSAHASSTTASGSNVASITTVMMPSNSHGLGQQPPVFPTQPPVAPPTHQAMPSNGHPHPHTWR